MTRVEPNPDWYWEARYAVADTGSKRAPHPDKSSRWWLSSIRTTEEERAAALRVLTQRDALDVAEMLGLVP